DLVLADQEGYAYSAYLVEPGQTKVFVIRPNGVIGAIVRGPILLMHVCARERCAPDQQQKTRSNIVRPSMTWWMQ
ncbi:hypothetical protein BDR05DRAFT_891842, partial [Suillus weaverae]